jgi:tetratricopeptide (TPR) repeat protein
MFLAWLGWSLSGMEHLVRADRFLCEALQMAEEIQDHRVMGLACAWLTWNRAELGRMDEAIEFGRRAQQIYLSFGGDQYVYFKSGAGIAWASYFKGDRKTMLAAAKDILAFGEIHGNLASSFFGRLQLAACPFLDGDISTAIELLEQLARERMDFMYYFAGQVGLGMSYLLHGQPDRARLPLEVTAHRFRTEVEWEFLAAWADLILAVVWIAEGRMGDGMARIEELRKQWLEHERRYFYTVSEHLLGMVYLQMAQGGGDLSISTLLSNLGFLVKHVPFAGRKAERHFSRAIDLGTEIGANAIVGQAYLDLGRLHKAKKRKEKARECLAKAIKYFELCEAGTFLKQAREELQSLG